MIAVPNADGRLYKLGLLLARRLGHRELMEELWYTHNPNMHRYYPTLPALAHMLRSARLRVVDSYTLEAFDWLALWKRGNDVARRAVLRVGGPLIGLTRFAARENLVVVAERSVEIVDSDTPPKNRDGRTG